MKLLLKFSLLILLTINFSCSKSNVIKLIKEEYSTTSVDNFVDYILIVSDADCMSCLDAIANQDNIKIIGFYHSKHPSIFRERLIKSYPNVIWKPLKNLEIPILLLEQYEDKHGPYIFKVYNNKIELVE